LKCVGDGKTAFYPLPCPLGNSLNVHRTTFSVIVLYLDWFQRIFMLITEVILYYRLMHICHLIYILYVFPCHCCQVTPHSVFMSPGFVFSLFQNPQASLLIRYVSTSSVYSLK
jgi:hypothetical protein